MSDLSPAHRTSIDAGGFQILPGVVNAARIAALIDALSRSTAEAAPRTRSNSVYATRNLLRLPIIRELARSKEFYEIIEPILGASAIPVRGILFDKTPDANWKVAWHQDLSIAVKSRIETPGFGPWSSKAGVHHVQPPRHVLENMLTLRLHLDECGEANGPLQVLPGSHAHGVLSPADISRWRTTAAPFSCLCPAGGVVMMRPLLLHASSSARLPTHRRVVHLEYAGTQLPGGLEWEAGEEGK